jgi:hypothetical protein
LHNANQNGERICHMPGQEFYVNSEWAWLKANDGFARLRKQKLRVGGEHSGNAFATKPPDGTRFPRVKSGFSPYSANPVCCESSSRLPA